MWASIAKTISVVTREPFKIESRSGVSGGCISASYKITGNGHTYFVKTNDLNAIHMFKAEAEGLRALSSTGEIAVPEPVCTGIASGHAYIVMQNIKSSHSGSAAHFGEQLAAMHSHTQAEFGWHIDNTIGATRQPNNPTNSWPLFWQQQRLGFQLQLAESKGHRGSLLEAGFELMNLVPLFFSDYQPLASILHGDLWSGNYTWSDGHAVIFDPAVYYGDRETDIAMTELFGGFPTDFYAGYNASSPLDHGYQIRKTLYNLYHILNHLNLFGGGYAQQAETMMHRLLSETKG